MTSHLDPLRLGFRRIGLILTIVSACLTGMFGLTMSSHFVLAVLIAIGLMCAAVASAYVWPFVASSLTDRRYGTAAFLAVFGALVTTTDLTTNFGSIAWQRGANLDEAKVSTVKYDDSRAKVEENRANLKMWKDHLAKLQTENAWVASVNADGLRANLDAAQKAIDIEAGRGGCGPKCLGLMKEKAGLEERIALAEQASDLTKKIDATQKLVDKYREQSAATEKVESAAALQNASLASMFTLTLRPTEEAQHWTDKGIAWLVAAFFSFGAMGCNFVGWSMPGFGGSRKDAGLPPPARYSNVSSVPSVPAAAAKQSTDQEQRERVINNTTVVDDTKFRAALWNRLESSGLVNRYA